MVNKKRWYSKLFLLCLAIFIISIPISLFIKDSIILLIINIILKILSITFIIYYSKKEKFEKPYLEKSSKLNLILLPFLIITFSNFFVVLYDGLKIYNNINVPNIILSGINCLLTAIIEEIIFRHFIFKEFKYTNSTFKSILFTSLIFGGMHLLNITSLGSIPTCIVQSLYTFGLGLVLSIIYLFTKNIIYPIVFHFLFNFINDILITNIFVLNWDLPFFVINIIIAILTGLYALYIYFTFLKEVDGYVS